MVVDCSEHYVTVTTDTVQWTRPKHFKPHANAKPYGSLMATAPALPSLSTLASKGVAPLHQSKSSTSAAHSETTNDILSSVASGDGFDVPLHSLVKSSGDVPPATITLFVVQKRQP